MGASVCTFYHKARLRQASWEKETPKSLGFLGVGFKTVDTLFLSVPPSCFCQVLVQCAAESRDCEELIQ